MQSSRWQKLAALPKQEQEQRIAAAKIGAVAAMDKLSKPRRQNRNTRIRDRALRRGGKLLAQMKAKPGGDHKSKGRAPASLIGIKKAANEAGLSPHQAKQMIRVANVPENQFEMMVEAKANRKIFRIAQPEWKPETSSLKKLVSITARLTPPRLFPAPRRIRQRAGIA